MRIKRIYIKDFGIFRDEKLDELSGRIVVIGGYNRAGKSSFMELLRHLGFGFFSNKGELPPANVEYQVNYDIETIGGEIYNIDIRGNKNPVVKGINVDKEVSINTIYSNIDYFTYKQLFTISLDELQNTGVKSLREVNDMQTIFLGAGFKEIAQVPQILKEMEKEAVKTGGKNGSPSTAQFKEYNKLIKKGIQLRDKAASDVKEYYDKSRELEEIDKEICKEEDKLKNKEKRIHLLRMIKSNFSSYERLKETELKIKIFEKDEDIKNFKYGDSERCISLKEEYEDLLYEYTQNIFIFKKRTGGDKELRDNLFNYKHKIQYFYNNISGILEKIKNYKGLKEKCIEKKEIIIKEIRDINEEWIDDFNKVLSIKTDIISLEDINNNIDEYMKLTYKKNAIEDELKSLEVNRKVMDKTNSKNTNEEIDKLIKKYFSISLIIIILGVMLSFLNYRAGIILALGGAVLGGMFAVIKYTSYVGEIDSSEDLRTSAESISNDIKNKKETYKDLCEKTENNKNKIDNYRSLLNLQREVSGETLKEYFRRIKESKNKIINLQEMINKCTKFGQGINEELTSMFSLIYQFSEVFSKDETEVLDGNLIKNADRLCGMIKTLNSHIALAEEFEIIQERKALLEDKIFEVIGDKYKEEEILTALEEYIRKSEEAKEIFHLKKEKEILENTLKSVFDASFINNYPEYDADYKKIFENYKLSTEIQDEYVKTERECIHIKEQIEKLKEIHQNLKYKLEVLRAEENIEIAEENINNGRKGLMPLAKRYASLRAAEYILKKLQSNFIEKTKDFLLKGASEYIYEITKGEYTDILPPEDLTNLEFKTILQDGSIQNTPDVLSRATKEQLFLAVRLSRIKDINPPLPLILDDSFVNFDEKHTIQAVKILLELSKTNQIFITTCHPQIVEYIDKQAEEVQYWKLEKGKFALTDKDSLVKYLV
ncbi:ATP-binding protein [Clostridium sp. ZS2-4]|uniref:ATP-binding protein n=1 Tax=Clostridium sp. ZS2-4 TaxID=2987703 RepID=UPI00227BB3C7|nr:AAA family ATPase [Clostridium sp. ZS2-4]MCY6355022.1 AAA family ATPase [Clostridium sp. ZS2-4]